MHFITAGPALCLFLALASALPVFDSSITIPERSKRESEFLQLSVRQISNSTSPFPPSATGASSSSSTGTSSPATGTGPDTGLQLCGPAKYSPSQYTCYNSNLLCPFIGGSPTKACGDDINTYACYLESQYSCVNGELVSSTSGSGTGSSGTGNSGTGSSGSGSSDSGSTGTGTSTGSATPVGTSTVSISTGAPLNLSNLTFNASFSSNLGLGRLKY